jgi:predicted cupin superfamily sugar epimerase
LCEQLRSGGAPGLHFYSMNQSTATLEICQRLSLVETASKGYALVACMVGPGFDFADFSLLHEQDAEAEFLLGISL